MNHDRPDDIHEETQYLRLIEKVLTQGSWRGDRTGTGTVSLFGQSMRFSLRDGRIPLFTTKRVFWRGIVEELLWFVSGNTNANVLRDKGIHIWDGHSSREYLDSKGFNHRQVGDLGPVYGFQWRHFGAKYTDMNADYTGQGIDQLQQVIDSIKHDPTSRRMVLTAWNPLDLDQMALPPCHMFCQFYVSPPKDDQVVGELSCSMYQRSCDLGLGVPFNVASYSLLTCMIAHVCGLRPGEFVYHMGDVHIYQNHIDPLHQQLLRTPFPFPTLKIQRSVSDIDSFVSDDFELLNYQCHPKIDMKMAV